MKSIHSLDMYMFKCMHVGMYVCMCACMHVCTRMYVCMWYACMYACIYIRMYIYRYRSIFQNFQTIMFQIIDRSIYLSVWLGIIHIDQNNRLMYLPHRSFLCNITTTVPLVMIPCLEQ